MPLTPMLITHRTATLLLLAGVALLSACNGPRVVQEQPVLLTDRKSVV